jgi:four helix bundle protein
VIAKGSCGELRTQLRIARMLNYLNEEEYILINEKALSTIK